MNAGLSIVGSLVLLLAACGGSTPEDDTPAGAGGTATVTSSGGGGATSTTGTGAATAGGGGEGAGIVACAECADATDAGTIANASVVEASGLVASKRHPGAFYVNNDSGDSPRFFAIGSDGADRGEYQVQNASANDWEDISRGPCADSRASCVYLADIGDNAMGRASYAVYRVEEPTELTAGVHTVSAETLAYTYPDGSQNSEALAVHPITGEIFILTKNANETKLYRFPMPLTPGTPVVLEALGEVNVPGMIALVTGADFSPSGDSLLVRTYPSVWQFLIPSGTPIAQALTARPCDLPEALERQGEAIAWNAAGSGYVTVSEGASATLHAYSCR